MQRTALPLTPTAPAAGGPATRKRHGFFVGPAADVLAQQDQLQQQQPRQPPKRRKLSNSSASSVDTGDAGDPSLEAESLAPPGARRNGARNGEQAQMAAPQQFRNVVHELQDQGLPVEMHYVRTQDGYWLPIVRVPLRGEGAGAAATTRVWLLTVHMPLRGRGGNLALPGFSIARPLVLSAAALTAAHHVLSTMNEQISCCLVGQGHHMLWGRHL